jgi:hypothetical protein
MTFEDHLESMSGERQPLIIRYEPNKKAELIQKIYGKYKNLEVIKAMNTYTEENLLGGLAPDASGKMTFQLSGLGAYLVPINKVNQNP